MTVTHSLPATNSAAFDLIAEHLSPHKAAAYRSFGIDLVQGRREGIRVWDLEGRDYINCRSSGGVFDFGHHPAFAVEALASAVQEHDMGDWLLPSYRRAQGAAALARLLPPPLRYSFFTASGAEAVEVACKLARSVTGRPGSCPPSTVITAMSGSPWRWTTRRCPRGFARSCRVSGGCRSARSVRLAKLSTTRPPPW